MLYQCQRELAIKYLTSKLQMRRHEFLVLPRLQQRGGIENGLKGMVDAGFDPEFEIDASEAAFWRRQFVLAGATIPSLGTKNVRDEIQKLFPSAEIISTQNLHKASDQLTYDWVEITSENRLEALCEAILADRQFQFGVSGKILIFTRDAAAVDFTTTFLTDNKIPCIPYHKKLGGDFRRANLKRFREESGVIMVSTDGMSRGMDVPDITHVIQSDFASSAIAFVHRVGRTGRAGRRGCITCLCTLEDRDLASAIRECIDQQLPIEGAFSRNRSFRKKFQRYGTFVPRGETYSGVV